MGFGEPETEREVLNEVAAVSSEEVPARSKAPACMWLVLVKLPRGF